MNRVARHAPQLGRLEADLVCRLEAHVVAVVLDVGEGEESVEACDQPALALHVARSPSVPERVPLAHAHEIADGVAVGIDRKARLVEPWGTYWARERERGPESLVELVLRYQASLDEAGGSGREPVLVVR